MLKLCLFMQPSWMEAVVTGHNFESILPKDHPCHVCFKLADWFQRRRLLNNFPIGPMLKVCLPLWWPFWKEIGVTEHNFGSWPPKDHRWHVCYIGWLVSEEKILKHFIARNFHMIYIDDIIHNCMCVIFWTWKWYIESSWIKWNKN